MNDHNGKIVIHKGKIMCNCCHNFIKFNESYKVDEIRHEVYCLECDINNRINNKFTTPMLTPLKLDLIKRIETIKIISKEKDSYLNLERTPKNAFLSEFNININNRY